MSRLSAVIMLVSMLMVGASIVIAGLPVYVVPCSKTTCEPLPHDSTLPNRPIGISNVVSISDSSECPGRCSSINTPTAQLHVIGNYIDMWCKVWGGQKCSGDQK